MVNILVHSVYSPAESTDDEDYYESTDSEQSEVLDKKVSPHIHQSFLCKWSPFNSTCTKSFSNKLFKSFGAVANITRSRKDSLERWEKFLCEMAKQKQTRFSLKQLKRCTQNFSTQIGLGCYGIVYKGVLPDGVPVAAKRLQDNSSLEDELMTEISIVGRTHHRNIVKLLGFCFEANIRVLVYVYMENGTLDDILFRNYPCKLDWEKLYCIAIETAKGIAYLHEDCPEMIVHYDIKPANILLDAQFCPKIADFGLAEIHNRDITHGTRIRGTYGYVAPELVRGEGSYRCDVYSFGMILFEIVGRRRNIGDTDSEGNRYWFPKHVWDEFEKGELDKLLVEQGIKEKDKQEAKRVCMAALWCVQYVPENRPCMSTVVSILKGDREAGIPPNPFSSDRHSYFTKSYSSASDSTRGGGILEANNSGSFTSVTDDDYEVSSCENSIKVG